MKQIGLFVLTLGLLSVSLSSCTNNDDTDVWRDTNLSFMRQIAQQEGVQTINDSISGNTQMHYTVLKEGTGAKPIYGNKVTVRYAGWMYRDSITIASYPTGTLLKKEAFDSSDEYTFRVGSSTIEGWSIALSYMNVGSKWRVFIPYNLAYGTSSSGSIKAYSALIFDIELLEIESDN